MSVPPGWPFPGQDMSTPRFEEIEDDQKTPTPASAKLASAPKQQTETSDLAVPPEQQQQQQQPGDEALGSACLLGSPGPAVVTSVPAPNAGLGVGPANQSHRSSQPSFTPVPPPRIGGAGPPIHNKKTRGRTQKTFSNVGRPHFTPRLRPTSSFYQPSLPRQPTFSHSISWNTNPYSPAVNMTHFPQSQTQVHGQGPMFNMPQSGHQQMGQQNGHGVSHHQGFYPQQQGPQGMAQGMFSTQIGGGFSQTTYPSSNFSHQPTYLQRDFPHNNFPQQNNFSQQGHFSHQAAFPQNNFPQPQMMLQSMMPQNSVPTTPMMMMMSPSPVPTQYQNTFGGRQTPGPMVPYQGGSGNLQMELASHPQQQQQQRPQGPRNTQPWAAKYAFGIDNTPPFVDTTRGIAPSEKPIICVKNIPYTITQNEIQQFMSKTLLPHALTHLTHPGPAALPIHIIMERGTGKTQDCFIELPSQDIANICIERVENLIMASKPPKMAQRIVNVEMSSQGELMKEIFPRAKNIMWDKKSGIPVMLKPFDEFCSTFRGFMTGEELNNVVRFAETPQRSPFAVRCQQRTFEMTMSTLAKFPWASIYYTLEQRDFLFQSYIKQLNSLLPKVFVEEYGGDRNQRVVGLDARLVAAFVDAGLNCPGFNEAQKSDILEITNQNYAYRGISEYAPAWPFECLTKPAGVGDQDLGDWMHLMKAGVDSAREQNVSLAVVKDPGTFVQVMFDEFGQICMQVSDDARTKLGFADLAEMELQLMKCIMSHGWEKVHGKKSVGMGEDNERSLTEVEHKMVALGVYKGGIERPHALIRSTQDASQGPGDKWSDDEQGRTSHLAGQQSQEICFEDPFSGRARSVASDSGFSGMHRAAELKDMTAELEMLAMRVHGNVSPHEAPESAEKIKPKSYANALGSMLIETENANAPTRTRGGSSAVPIRSPDGKEFDFSKEVLTPASSFNGRHGSADEGRRTSDPFVNTPTPRRRSEPITGSGGSVSPHTKTTSPKKSYTIKVPAAQVLGPAGTPSRRSTQDNTITIGDTINEEAEDEAIVMRGGRGRGQSRSFR